MIFLDIAIIAVLCALPYVLKGILSYKSINLFAHMDKQRALGYIGCGVFFALGYAGFRFMSERHLFLNPFYFFIIIFALILPFVVLFLTPSQKSQQITVLVFGLVLLFFPIGRMFYFPLGIGRSIVASLPLHICNISCILYIFAVTTKNKVVHNYTVSFGLIGGIIALFVTQYNDQGYPFWNLRNFESCLMHIILFTANIYLLLTDRLIVDYKAGMQNLYWMMPTYVVMIFVNQISNNNFFFTRQTGSMKLPLYDDLPILEVGNMEFNIIFYILMLLIFPAVLHFYMKGAVLIDKHLKNNREVQNEEPIASI